LNDIFKNVETRLIDLKRVDQLKKYFANFIQ